MRYVKKIAVLAFIGGLAACSSTPSAEKVADESAPPKLSKQVTNNSVAPVAISEGQDAVNQNNTYAVPPIANQETTAAQASIAPPGSNMAQITAQKAPAPVPTKAVSSGGSSVTVKTAYSQAWSKLGSALPSAGYPVMEQDSGAGTYYILDKAGSGGVIKRDTPIYQVHLEKAGSGTRVTVLNAQNQAADANAAGRILGVVQSKLN